MSVSCFSPAPSSSSVSAIELSKNIFLSENICYLRPHQLLTRRLLCTLLNLLQLLVGELRHGAELSHQVGNLQKIFSITAENITCPPRDYWAASRVWAGRWACSLPGAASPAWSWAARARSRSRPVWSLQRAGEHRTSSTSSPTSGPFHLEWNGVRYLDIYDVLLYIKFYNMHSSTNKLSRYKAVLLFFVRLCQYQSFKLIPLSSFETLSEEDEKPDWCLGRKLIQLKTSDVHSIDRREHIYNE